MKNIFDHSKFSSIVFIDSMIGLECKPLDTLPWHEIDETGPILIMVVPQVNAEVDKRKRDGRLGKRARSFNRLMGPAAESGKPNRIVASSPEVYVCVARCSRIGWGVLDDLDPQEGDHKVVAQIIHTKGVPEDRKVLLSHDTNPIFLASSHGLKCIRLPESWLLEPEPHPKDKEITRLNQRVRELEESEPRMEWDVEFDVPPNLTVYKIDPLPEHEKRALKADILQRNPRLRQNVGGLRIGLNFDHNYDDKYDTFVRVSIPEYVDSIHSAIEAHFAQVPFTFCIRNVGHVQAEDLIVSLRSTYGTIHDKFKLRGVFPPLAPQLEPYNPLPNLFRPSDFRQPVRDRHEITFIDEPDGSGLIQFQCGDFRHGREWSFSGVAMVDPHCGEPFSIEVELTASNIRGRKNSQRFLTFEVATGKVVDFVDLEKREFLRNFPLKETYDAAMSAEGFGWFDIKTNTE